MTRVSDIKFNQKRKELLLKKDINCYVSNRDLGFYDLTTYYSVDENNEESLIDKILIYENEGRKIQHIKNKDLYLMPEQEETIIQINEHDRIIVSAPTSFGKTLILKEYIYRNKNKLKNIIYIVPTNALAYELEKDFKTNISFKSDYLVFDKNKNKIDNGNQKKLLFIGTQEKYMEINDSFDYIDLFVIDEAYKLQESAKKQRGFKLSETFIEAINNKSTKIVLLTPNARLKGFDKFDFFEYQTHFNAVDKKFHIINEIEFNDVLFEKAKEDKTILYCESPNDMIEISNDTRIINEINDDFVTLLEEEFHPDWSVIKLLKKGILTHHGLMPKYVQNHMIDLFINDDNYNLIIGTNSISEGINTPTKNLFFNKNINIQNLKHRKETLLYKNTIGRAGRLGRYPIGHIYSTNSDFEKICEETIEIELAVSKKESLDEISDSKSDEKINAIFSSYNLNNNLCIQKIKSLCLSVTKLQRTFEVLKKDLKYCGIANVPFMGQSVFKEDYEKYLCINDKIYIRGCLQYSYKDIEGKNKQLTTFKDKIDFFNCQYSMKNKKTPSNSTIIEGYMRFIYSTLEYYILPVMKVGKFVIEYQNNWCFGKNVKETIDDFFNKYYKVFLGVNIDQFSDNQKKILQALKEYGISLKDIGINSEILDEIDSELNIRYSTFDVVNAIEKLSKKDSKYKNVYVYILNRYVN